MRRKVQTDVFLVGKNLGGDDFVPALLDESWPYEAHDFAHDVSSGVAAMMFVNLGTLTDVSVSPSLACRKKVVNEAHLKCWRCVVQKRPKSNFLLDHTDHTRMKK